MSTIEQPERSYLQKETIAGYEFKHVVRRIPEFYDQFGKWILHLYEDVRGPYWVKTVGDLTTPKPIVMRIDDHCITGFDLGHIATDEHPDTACDCRQQSEISRTYIQHTGRGIVIHTPHEARGHGPLAKALQLKVQGEAIRDGNPVPDTVACFEQTGFTPSDIRDYTPIKAILTDLGLSDAGFLLLTNNNRKTSELKRLGITIERMINVYAPSLVKYYQGPNFESKMRLGHIGPPDVLPDDGIVDQS